MMRTDMFSRQRDYAVEKARYLKEHMYPCLRNLALQRGLVEGHQSYVKFVILARSRVGSNYLRSALNSHSQIAVFGELFQQVDTIAWDRPGYPQSGRTVTLYQEAPAEFLESKVFHLFPPYIAAVGFKLFYYHAQEGGRQAVWEYLRANREIKILHLKRKNILKTHLSRQRAVLTDRWINTSGSVEKYLPVTLDYEACLEDFVQTRQWEQTSDAFFAEHDMIELFYEDLTRTYPAEMNRIQRFLGVDQEDVLPQTYKQASQPLSQAIMNYHALKERFAGTPWEPFFTE